MDSRQHTKHAICPSRHVKGMLEADADFHSETRHATSPGNGMFWFTPPFTPKIVPFPYVPSVRACVCVFLNSDQ